MTKFEQYLSVPLSNLAGVGTKTLQLLHNLKCYTLFDLLLHLPTKFIIKEFEPENLANIEENKYVVISVIVKEVLRKEGNNIRKQLVIVKCCTSYNEDLELVFSIIFQNIFLKP